MPTGIQAAHSTRTVYALLLMFVIGLIIIGFVLLASGVWWTGSPASASPDAPPFTSGGSSISPR